MIEKGANNFDYGLKSAYYGKQNSIKTIRLMILYGATIPIVNKRFLYLDRSLLLKEIRNT